MPGQPEPGHAETGGADEAIRIHVREPQPEQPEKENEEDQ